MIASGRGEFREACSRELLSLVESSGGDVEVRHQAPCGWADRAGSEEALYGPSLVHLATCRFSTKVYR